MPDARSRSPARSAILWTSEETAMAIEIKVPRLGWSMEEGTFVEWLKREGESVQAGEPLFAIEGDKAIQEVEAIGSGILRISPRGPENGETVKVGVTLAFLVGPDEADPFHAEPRTQPVAIPRQPERTAKAWTESREQNGDSADDRVRRARRRREHVRTAADAFGRRTGREFRRGPLASRPSWESTGKTTQGSGRTRPHPRTRRAGSRGRPTTARRRLTSGRRRREPPADAARLSPHDCRPHGRKGRSDGSRHPDDDGRRDAISSVCGRSSKRPQLDRRAGHPGYLDIIAKLAARALPEHPASQSAMDRRPNRDAGGDPHCDRRRHAGRSLGPGAARRAGLGLREIAARD